MDTYLTPADVAAKLGRSVVSVQRYCRAGLLPGAIQIGRSWGIPPAAVAGFVKPEPGNPEFGPDFWPNRQRKRARKKSARESKKSAKTT